MFPILKEFFEKNTTMGTTTFQLFLRNGSRNLRALRVRTQTGWWWQPIRAAEGCTYETKFKN